MTNTHLTLAHITRYLSLSSASRGDNQISIFRANREVFSTLVIHLHHGDIYSTGSRSHSPPQRWQVVVRVALSERVSGRWHQHENFSELDCVTSLLHLLTPRPLLHLVWYHHYHNHVSTLDLSFPVHQVMTPYERSMDRYIKSKFNWSFSATSWNVWSKIYLTLLYSRLSWTLPVWAWTNIIVRDRVSITSAPSPLQNTLFFALIFVRSLPFHSFLVPAWTASLSLLFTHL